MKIMDNDLPLSHWRRIAAQNGIGRKTFNYRLKRHTPRVAATMPKHNKGNVAKPDSARQCSLKNGLAESAIGIYKRKNPDCGLSHQEIADKIIAARKTPTLEKLAKEKGLSRAMVAKRIKKGWTQDEALNTPPMTNSEAARYAGKHKGKKQREERAARQRRNAQIPSALNNALTQ